MSRFVQEGGDRKFWEDHLSDTSKPTNPKDAVGIRKPSLFAMPMPPLFEIGVVMTLGAHKYGKHNWRDMGVRSTVYFDAVMRHLTVYFEGEDFDPESGVSHLAHAAACLIILLDAGLHQLLKDDRPIATKDGWLAALLPFVDQIREEFPDPPAPYTQERSQRSSEAQPEEGPS